MFGTTCSHACGPDKIVACNCLILIAMTKPELRQFAVGLLVTGNCDASTTLSSSQLNMRCGRLLHFQHLRQSHLHSQMHPSMSDHETAYLVLRLGQHIGGKRRTNDTPPTTLFSRRMAVERILNSHEGNTG